MRLTLLFLDSSPLQRPTFLGGGADRLPDSRIEYCRFSLSLRDLEELIGLQVPKKAPDSVPLGAEASLH